MEEKNQGAPAARTATREPDSLVLIARDAATYAEGASEPEFSQFLQIEDRLLALLKVPEKAGQCVAMVHDEVRAGGRYAERRCRNAGDPWCRIHVPQFGSTEAAHDEERSAPPQEEK